MKHLINCLHPKVLRNPYTHEIITVPCGHCDACKMSSAFIWTQRIEHECQSQKYSLFFTLTYDNEHVPVLDLDLSSFTYVYKREHTSKFHRPFDLGECFSVSELGHLSKKDFNYVLETPELYVLSKRHVQLFIKRLRYFFSKYEKKSVRYWICGELGPTTFRPHYHGILWFEDEKAASEIRTIISKAWQYGFIDTSYVRNSCSTYVASYVNCFAYLPKIYSHKLIRPFFLCSKCPPIGAMYYAVAEIPQNVLVSDSTFKGFQGFGKESCSVPNWRFVENTLFPRFSGFGRLSHFERVTLYGLSKISACSDRYSFRAWCKNQCSSYDTPLTRFLNSKGVYPFGVTLSLDMRKQEMNFLNNLYSISRKVLYNCTYLGYTLNDYVTIIEEYYHKKEIRRLREFYEFQQDFVSSGFDVRELVFCDVSFTRRIVDNKVLNLIFEGYGYDTFPSLDKFDLTKTYGYELMSNFYRKLSTDSRKVKKMNDKLGILNSSLLHAQFNYHYSKI